MRLKVEPAFVCCFGVVAMATAGEMLCQFQHEVLQMQKSLRKSEVERLRLENDKLAINRRKEMRFDQIRRDLLNLKKQLKKEEVMLKQTNKRTASTITILTKQFQDLCRQSAHLYLHHNGCMTNKSLEEEPPSRSRALSNYLLAGEVVTSTTSQSQHEPSDLEPSEQIQNNLLRAQSPLNVTIEATERKAERASTNRWPENEVNNQIIPAENFSKSSSNNSLIEIPVEPTVEHPTIDNRKTSLSAHTTPPFHPNQTTNQPFHSHHTFDMERKNDAPTKTQASESLAYQKMLGLIQDEETKEECQESTAIAPKFHDDTDSVDSVEAAIENALRNKEKPMESGEQEALRQETSAEKQDAKTSVYKAAPKIKLESDSESYSISAAADSDNEDFDFYN